MVGKQERFKNYVRKNIITTWHLQLSYYMRRYSSDVYLGMSLVQNGGSYLRNVLAHVGKTSENGGKLEQLKAMDRLISRC